MFEMLGANKPGYQIKIGKAERYSKVLTLGIIQMHLTWLYNKPTLPILACAGGDGIDTAII